MASASPQPLRPEGLQPYASFAVLIYTGPNVELACSAITAQLKRAALKETAARRATLLAEGLDDGWLENVIDTAGGEVVNIEAFAYRVTKTPSWAKRDSEFTIATDELSIAFQRNDLVAVHCPRGQVDSLQRWLNKDPRPPFRRVPGAILQHAFLQGEARGLWLRGTHRRQTTKADTKNLSGISLADALNPFEDSSFALTSGRSFVDPDRHLAAINGTIGTTPRRAWVWNSRADSLATFSSIAREALTLVAEVMDNPPIDLPFPELAVEVDSFAQVTSAYDAYISEPDEISQLPDASEDMLDRAEVLRDVLINVEGDAGSPNFTLSVGPGGAEVAKIRCRPSFDHDCIAIDMRFAAPPSDPAAATAIRDALGDGEFLNVYFESGHVLARGALTKVNQEHRPFKGWSFHDFSSFDPTTEKPPGLVPQDIHDRIGLAGDQSLFGWVAAHFAQGHLTCDDGANEVADFIHLSNDGLLTLLHAKAASVAARRRVAAGAFELVVSQASKNLRYLNPTRLAAALRSSPLDRPATWQDGVRTNDRESLLDALRQRPASADALVVILQPHHTESLHQSLRATPTTGATTQDGLRLQLVETLLNSARGAAVGLGAELAVWASK